MNARIRTLIEDVESRLPDSEQDELAQLMEAFLAARQAAAAFTPAELAHLRQIDAEPFAAADPAAVAALFARRG